MPSAEPPSTSSRSSKPISISFGAPKPKGPPIPPPRKRPHSALADHSDGEDEAQPAAQLVSGFDQSGAVITNGRKEEKALLVIQAEKNRDWREESRKKRRKNLLPADVQAARSGTYAELEAAQVERDEVSRQSGISFAQKDQDGDTTMAEGQTSQRAPAQAARAPKTEDEEAMEALLGGEKKSNLVIPISEDNRDDYKLEDSTYEDYANEEDRFKADVASRPDVSTLDEYAAVPVEGFGAAMMRGMSGWKDGDPVGKRRTQGTTSDKPRIVERRPAFLGIGAKEVPNGIGDEELGAWGKGAKGKRKTDLTYNPVILKNSVTGEMLTEEELEKKKKLEISGKGQEDWRERRDRNLAIDGRRKEERRERLLIEENGHSSSRHSSSRRERSRSKERRRRDRSRSGERSSYSSSRRRSRSRDKSHHYGSSRRERSPHKSSRRDRSRSDERRYRRY